MYSRSTHFIALALLASQSVWSQETRPEEVIVTATALRESALDIAQPVTVMSGDELRRQIASSIGETIAGELGVSATYFGPSASRPLIRGLGGERVLVLQDGVSTLDVSNLSQDHGVAIETVLADQVEVLKGPAALLFGSGAVGGVVNVVDGRIPTAFSADANRMAVEARGDTALEERTGVGRVELGGDIVRIHADAYRRETADTEIPGYAFARAERAAHLTAFPEEDFERNRLANSDSETSGGAFGVSAGSGHGFIGASWARYETQYGVPGGHAHAQDEGSEQPDHASGVRIDLQQDRYDFKGERRIEAGPFRSVRARGAYNDYTHQELEGAEIGTRFEQQAWELRMNLDHGDAASAGWRGTVGVQYVEIDFTALGDEAFVPPSTTTQLSAFTFQKRTVDRLSVELSARVERQEIEATSIASRYADDAFSFGVGGVWSVATPYSLALNATRSQRHPQASELFADGPHLALGRFEIGDAGLSAERSNNIDLSFHRHAEQGVHWSVGAFYNDFADYIYSAPTGAAAEGAPGFRYTQADAQFHGFEAELTLPIVRGVSEMFEMRIATDWVRGRLQEGGDLPQIPPLRYGVEVHYELDQLHLGLEAYRYDAQDKTAAGERPTDGYTAVDVDVSYRIPFSAAHNVLVFLRGSNLLDEEARRHSSPLKEVAPLPGRSFLLGARAEFNLPSAAAGVARSRSQVP